MKKYFIYFLFLIVSINSHALTNRFEITPIVINFQGVQAKNDTIIAYGDYGSMLISYDFGNSWKQIKVFEKGMNIVGLFWNDISMVAFNDAGDVARSIDKGMNWDYVTNLGDSLLAVIKYSDGYFLRGRNKLFTITDDFQSKNEYQLYSRVLTSTLNFYKPNYTRSLAYFKNELIAEADSSDFIRFDKNLIPIDTFSLYKTGIFDTTYTYITGYQVDIDSQYFYFKLEAEKNINDSTSRDLDSIYRTNDFKIFESVAELSQPYSIYRLINNKLYFLQKDSKYLIDTTKFISKNPNYYLYGNDFIIVGDTQIIVGLCKIIEMVDIKDSSIKLISEFSRFNTYLEPLKIRDSSYIFFTGNYNLSYNSCIYRTDNNGIIIKPTVDNQLNDYKYFLSGFYFKYFNKMDNKFYFIGRGDTMDDLFMSDNNFKIFISKEIKNFTFLTGPEIGDYINARNMTNFNINKDDYIITDGWFIYKGTLRENITTLSNEFEIKSRLLTKEKVIDYVFSKDTNTFLIHNANTIDRTSEINYTSDHGVNWETIKKYPITDTLKNYREIEINNLKYLALVHYNGSIPSFKFDVINLENNQFNNICEWTTNNPDSAWGWFGVAIDCENNWVYITFQDTLFYTNNIFDKSKWRYQILPNNGRVRNFPFKKFSDRFFVGYADDNYPSSNGIYARTNIFWLKPLDSILSVEENEIEVRNYLYAYPPFPIPANNYIKTLIYWDLSLDIDKDEIAVYNIYGLKIEGKENIRIDKKTSYSGWLVWDCPGVESGIYFIKINHGTKTIYLKVMVDR